MGLALLPVLLGLAACHHPPVHVVSMWPTGQQSDAVEQSITVTFDRDMVKDDQVHAPAEHGPLHVAPPVAGRFVWDDRQTLVFQASQPLPLSTEFTVSVDPDLRSLDGGRLASPFSGTFDTQRLSVLSLDPPRHYCLTPTTTLSLTFSQPVAPADVAAHCAFALPTSSVAARLANGEKTGSTTQVALQPAHPLALATSYRLRCDRGLKGVLGPLDMGRAYEDTIRTYDPVAVVSASPTGNYTDTDGLKIQITFSTPIKDPTFGSRLSASPDIPGLRSGMFSDDGFSYSATVQVQPYTEYELSLSQGVVDAFGQKLAQPYTWRFMSGGEDPLVYAIAGTYVVEKAQPTYPLWIRNVKTLSVSAARVPPDKLGAVLAVAPFDPEDDQERSDDTTFAGVLSKLGLDVRTQQPAVPPPSDKWVDEALSPAALSDGGSATGVFALAVDSPDDKRGERRILVNVTDLGLVAKIGASSGLVWAVHLSDGKPAAGARIEIRDGTSAVRFTGTTGADGTVETPGTRALAGAASPDAGSAPSDRVLVTATDASGDLAVLSGTWTGGLQPWSFDLPQPGGPAQRIRGFIQTDRGLYRPGETVHIKGLARELRLHEGFRVPPDRQVAVEIQDAHGDKVLDSTVPLSAYGGFHLDLDLDKEARLGDWAVQATVGAGADASQFTDHFTVEEYRPATFEVKLAPAKDDYQIGDTAQVNLQARYLFGAPLSGGKVQYSVQRRDHFPTFDGFDGYVFNDLNALEDEGYWWARYGERGYTYDVADGEAEVDSRGHAQIHFTTEDGGTLKAPQDYLVSTTVTDAAHQSIDSSTVVHAHRSPLYLGIQFPDWMATVDKPFLVSAVAVNDEGKPVDAKAELVVSLRSWVCNGWNHSCEEKTTELERRTVLLSKRGPTALSVTSHAAGTLLVSLRAADAKGQEVVASDELWAEGGGDAWWPQQEQTTHFRIVSNKRRYKPGETARLLAQCPLVGGLALVTLERDGVLSHSVLPYDESGKAFRIPISQEDTPNVYASIFVVHGRSGPGASQGPEMGMGLVGLEVDASSKKLNVKVSTDRPSYRPGQTVTARLAVTDASGAPIQSEVALAAADEGVLELINYQTPDPLAAFYAPIALSVQTATNWDRLAKRTDPNNDATAYIGDSGGNQSGHPRSKFLATAYWNPAIVTGADGTATVTFPAPDNLTAFRLMASAADATDRFGSGDVRMTVAKPLAALPALPRFFTVGDKARVGVVVNNNTKAAGTVTVSAEAQGATLEGKATQKVDVPVGGSKLVTFAMAALNRVGTSTFTFRAALGAETDAVQVSVPVERPYEDASEILGAGDIATPTSLPVSIPPNAAPDVGSLEVLIDTTGLASKGIGEALRYLIEYPFG